jgi:hypothetical protein
MNDFFVLIFIIFLFIYLFFVKEEDYSPIPDISMGTQWGSTPTNLYENEEDTQNYFGSDLRFSLQNAEKIDTKYARGMGLGLKDIQQKINSGQISRIYYR